MKQILAFILFSALFCWLMFSPMYRHVVILRQALLQKEVDYMLEIGANASHGYISEHMVQQSRARLAERGFDPTRLTYHIRSLSGATATDPNHPLIRGDGLLLEIRYPYERLFVLDRLLGISAPDETDTKGARGLRMSEYVPSMPLPEHP